MMVIGNVCLVVLLQCSGRYTRVVVCVAEKKVVVCRREENRGRHRGEV